MPLLINALRAEFRECEIEKICHRNVLRLMSDVMR